MRRSIPLVLLSITLSIVATVLASIGARLVREARSSSDTIIESEGPA